MDAIRSGLTGSFGASSSSTPASARFRLRNSCHHCASSKLKCSQEKPTCSRCAKRGLTCEYLAAKQGGRKPNRHPTSCQTRAGRPAGIETDAHAYEHLPPQDNWAAPTSSNPDNDPLRSPDIIPSSPRTSISSTSNVIQDLFGAIDQIPLSPSPPTQIDFSDYLSTPVSFTAEMTDMDILGTAKIFFTGVDSSNNDSESPFDVFPPFGDTVSELFTVSIPSPTPKTSILPSMEVAQNYPGFHAAEPPHSCLIRALGSMEQISPVSCLKGTSTTPTIRAVIAQNKAAIDGVGKMLRCACSQDGYLLAVLSLIIFKVLDWYAAVAQRRPGLQDHHAPGSRPSSTSTHCPPSPTVIGNYCLEGTDSARMAAQLVLSELYIVRRLVEQLSSKLKEQAAKTGKMDETETENLELENDIALPLSAAIYGDLAVALTKRLKALSLNIISQLKKL
ncbi:aflatoxin regulatory protein-domain-containing protein [Hypoxylon crocopeplum]|nr:aflatoxin regulatory protein-domain-containing protein [Hypoxylon crocopeplum]